jgi:hypothetical protein
LSLCHEFRTMNERSFIVKSSSVAAVYDRRI